MTLHPQCRRKALEFFLQKINEHPERYRIIRAARDIDEAIARASRKKRYWRAIVNRYRETH